MNRKNYLLVGSSEVTLDMNWHVDESIIIITCSSEIKQILHKVVGLLNQFEVCQKAIRSTRCVTLRVLLKSYNPSIHEGIKVVPIEDFTFKVHPFIWFFISLRHRVNSRHHMVESIFFSVTNNFMCMSTPSLLNNCLVVKFLCYGMNKTNETSSILSF